MPNTAYAQRAVRRPIISLAGTYGCRCPYDSVVMGNGSVYRCGKASSWSQTGGNEDEEA